jgi:hypothetical protein
MLRIGDQPVSSWVITDAAILLLCASLYLGTGWSLVLFSFPIAPKLTPANYYDHFVPQIKRAMTFFTWVTNVMLLTGIVLIVVERKHWYAVWPALALVGVAASAFLTVKFIFPYNRRMAAGIEDAGELQRVLDRWMFLSRVRNWIWTGDWIAVVTWFALRIH